MLLWKAYPQRNCIEKPTHAIFSTCCITWYFIFLRVTWMEQCFLNIFRREIFQSRKKPALHCCSTDRLTSFFFCCCKYYLIVALKKEVCLRLHAYGFFFIRLNCTTAMYSVYCHVGCWLLILVCWELNQVWATCFPCLSRLLVSFLWNLRETGW